MALKAELITRANMIYKFLDNGKKTESEMN